MGGGRCLVELVEVSESWPGHHGHQKKVRLLAISHLHQYLQATELPNIKVTGIVPKPI